MAKKRRTQEDRLAAALALKDRPPSPELAAELKVALQDPWSKIVEAAADAARAAGLPELGPELAAAFARWIGETPPDPDKGCAAKAALAGALAELSVRCEDVYLAGVRLVQIEFEKTDAGWRECDVAGPVRTACALGLLRTNHPDTVPTLIDLLADDVPFVRGVAARYLGSCLPMEVAAALRLKVRIGDDDPAVLSECFQALLGFQLEGATAFVATYLEKELEVAEAAAWALGNARQAEAAAALLDFWRNSPNPALRDQLFLALAISRQPAATAYLLECVAEPKQAAAAVQALAALRHDPKLKEAAAAAVANVGTAALSMQFAEAFEIDPERRRLLRERKR